MGENSEMTRPIATIRPYQQIKDIHCYLGMTHKEAASLLDNKPQGTFILRNSSNFNGIYSITLKGAYGHVTSIRVKNCPRCPLDKQCDYCSASQTQNMMCLDCEQGQEKLMRHFPDIYVLIQHYMSNKRDTSISSTTVTLQPFQLTSPYFE